MKYIAELGGRTFEVERLARGLRLEGSVRAASLAWLADDELQLTLDGKNHHIFAHRRPDGWRLTVRGRSFDVRVEDERSRALRTLSEGAGTERGSRELRAPMPGLVRRVLARVGERVSAGDGLVVIEAMKMENELRAHDAGTVSEVAVRAGESVDRDQLLLTLEADRS